MATLTATNLGTVTYLIEPSLLKLAAGSHLLRLSSLLITMTTTFSTH